MGWLADAIFGEPKNTDTTSQHEVDVWQGEERAAEAEQPVTDPEPPAPVQREFPVVDVIRTEPKLSSDSKHLELWLCFENQSQAELEITKIDCLGRETDPSRYLKPGENHEIQVYYGDTPRDDAERVMRVTYKDVQANAYYQAEHIIKYRCAQHEDDDFYIPADFDLVRPVRPL